MPVDAYARMRIDGLAAAGDPTARARLNSLSRVCAIEGDSRGDYAHRAAGKTARGFPHWLEVISESRVFFPDALNTAVSGNNTEEVLARMPTSIAAAVAAGAGSMWIITGANDRGALWNAARTMTALNSVISLVRAAGLLCFIWVDTARGDTVFGNNMDSSQYAVYQDVKIKYRALHNPQNGVFILDCTPAWDDPSSTICQNLPYITYDTIHDSQKGAYQRALSALPTVTKLWAPNPIIFPTSNSQGYSATNPKGILTSNPMVTGTTGTIGAAAVNASGQLANSWNLTCNGTGGTSLGSSITTVLSKVTKSDGTVWQQAVLSGTPVGSSTTAAYVTFWQSVSLANAPAGSLVRTASQIEWDAGHTGILEIAVGSEASFSGGLVANYAGLNDLAAKGFTARLGLLPTAGAYAYQNEGTLVPASPTFHSMNIRIQTDTDTPIALTMRFRACGASLV